MLFVDIKYLKAVEGGSRLYSLSLKNLKVKEENNGA
jgi:hypothetical protein